MTVDDGLDREAIERRAERACAEQGWACEWQNDYADDVPALLAALKAAEAENERHRKANLVRAVVRYAEGHDFDGWVAESINAENFDAVPWRVAEMAIEKAKAAEARLRAVLAEMGELFGYEGDDGVQGLRAIAQYALRGEAAEAEVERLREAIRRVLWAHRSVGDGYCAEDGFLWPCATVREFAGVLRTEGGAS